MYKVLIAMALVVFVTVGCGRQQAIDDIDLMDEEVMIETEAGENEEEMDTIIIEEPIEPVEFDEDGEPISEDMEAVNAEILERLEAQSELGLEGEELTDADVQLIQEILDAVTSSVEGQ